MAAAPVGRLLAVGSLGAALASDWFVEPSAPAIQQPRACPRRSPAWSIVAIASNAVEHVVGHPLRPQGQARVRHQPTLNSPLQVALLLTPVLVLLSRVVGPTQLTLVFPPLLVAALAASALVVALDHLRR